MPRVARSAVLVLASIALLTLVPASVGSDVPCTEPTHAVVPADSIDASPAGQLRWLLDHGYPGDIYDAHTHLFIIPETALLPSLTDPTEDR